MGYSNAGFAVGMLTPPKSPARLAFGPFEVNASSGELFKHGSRVRLPKQPFQILLFLLEQPGELVTREQLLAKIWGDGTFVDFEHSLNAAMNRLRQSLGDSAERPRYIETVPGRGYRFIGALERPPSAVPITPEPVIREEPRNRKPSFWWALAAALVGVISLAEWWRFHDAAATLPSGKVIRLTTDAGLSDSPAISRDGKLVTYSSDIAAEGQMDLYIKQVTGGQPIRLTFDGASNTNPNFSPDSSKIVFESRRAGAAGVYEIPTVGGQSRLLARDGMGPVYSPDGSQVAYWMGARGVALAVPGTGAVWVVPVAGGPPQRVAPNLTTARWPIWSPDGNRLLFNATAPQSRPITMA